MKAFVISVLALVICIPIGVYAISGMGLSGGPLTVGGPNAAIHFTAGSKMPNTIWDALQIDALPHEVRVARVQLAPETAVWMVTAAPRRFDVHIPRRDLMFINDNGAIVQQIDACTPKALGSFRTKAHWDIRCADNRMLRYDGERYARVL